VLERQRGLAGMAGADWAGYARRAVFGDGSAWRAALRRQSPEALEAGEAIARRAAPFRDAQLSGADLVHMDFGLHNVLFRSGEVVAVVDLEGVGRGPVAVDVATVCLASALFDWCVFATGGWEPEAVTAYLLRAASPFELLA